MTPFSLTAISGTAESANEKACSFEPLIFEGQSLNISRHHLQEYPLPLDRASFTSGNTNSHAQDKIVLRTYAEGGNPFLFDDNLLMLASAGDPSRAMMYLSSSPLLWGLLATLDDDPRVQDGKVPTGSIYPSRRHS
ncbi:uncharacterized protein ARMOST_12249 [Armillaria ostoyae]|uniref:Uncharacterized protein n=1 Tax=Armillaria ostoyae TaxID=47428 RepID=A0A284RJI2_ARMOS|nr:uncharacterized protein ARMOST_12249 [Armillaria ostoyae]